MKSLKSICVALCAAVVLVGCNVSNTAKGTAIGAGGGAALGAIVGAIAGNTVIGAAIGTAVGAGAGAIIAMTLAISLIVTILNVLNGFHHTDVEKVKLMKNCSMTCNFLNAVIFLYGNRYEEAIGYADMVLSRKQCLEAMFIKGRSLYELERYDEAYDAAYQIISISQEGEEKKAIDKKLVLFEARVNKQIGNSVIPFCKQLISLCPEYVITYKLMRAELHDACKTVDFDKDEENTDLLEAFNNRSISQMAFLKMVKECKDVKSIMKLRKGLSKM